jgi:nucleoside phosphorylase
VVAALKKEIDLFLDALEGLRRRREGSCSCYAGSLAHRPVRVIRTGMGRADVDPCLFGNCSLVLSTGFCGALSPLLARGDFVVSTNLVARTVTGERLQNASMPGAPANGGLAKTRIPISKTMRKSLERAALETGAVLWFGATFTADRVIRTPEEKAALHGACGALSVEMEDLHRLECAARSGLPFLSLRVVLDTRVERVPSLRSAVRIPADTADLLKGANICARKLASLLVRFVEKFEMA